MEGWIKIHRKIMDWEWKSEPNMIALWIDLLCRANHAPHRWQGIEVERGQCITGLKSLSASTGISTQSLRTCLDRLKSSGQVTIKSNNRYSVITLINYANYQCRDDSDDNSVNTQNNKQATSQQQTSNKRVTTNKNDKNDKNEENILPASDSPPNYEDQKLNELAARHFLPDGDWMHKSVFINTGRRPLKKYPNIWISPPELQIVLDVLGDALEQRHWKRVFQKVDLKARDQLRLNGDAARLNCASWLQGWAFNETLNEVSAINRVKKSTPEPQRPRPKLIRSEVTQKFVLPDEPDSPEAIGDILSRSFGQQDKSA